MIIAISNRPVQVTFPPWPVLLADAISSEILPNDSRVSFKMMVQIKMTKFLGGRLNPIDVDWFTTRVTTRIGFALGPTLLVAGLLLLESRSFYL